MISVQKSDYKSEGKGLIVIAVKNIYDSDVEEGVDNKERKALVFFADDGQEVLANNDKVNNLKRSFRSPDINNDNDREGIKNSSTPHPLPQLKKKSNIYIS